MKLRSETARLFALPLSIALGISACGGDDGGAGESESESGTGSETENATETGTASAGDGDGAPGDGDGTPGDGDGAPGDGDGAPCPIGSDGCPCTGGGACDPGLMCDAGTCVPASGDGDGAPGDGDGAPGDGDGVPGDGDGAPNTACQDDQFIEIAAVDATDINGWDPVMSMLGEGMILQWDQNVPDASVQFDIDIPCDADWHIWVRAINAQQNDSFFVQVDGGPMPVPIFEINCDQGPQQAVYEWRELNWRDPMDPACTYVEDPWVQTWTAGPHTFVLGYRESYALSRIWLTNTNQTPP